MIFKDGFVHCDPHPGNILVRANPSRPGRPQVVLLDHGFYCTLSDEFRCDFSRLWYALNTFDYVTVKEISGRLGMGEYFRFLPLLFTARTINS